MENPDDGRDELNLASFPITLISSKPPAGVSVLTRTDTTMDSNGNPISHEVKIIGSAEYGLPTPSDDDVIVALIQLSRLRNNFTSPRVSFTQGDLIKMLRWSDGGDNHKRAMLSLKRWNHVTLEYNQSWWDKKKKKYATDSFHIIERIRTKGTFEDENDEDTASHIVAIKWSEAFFESLKEGNVKTLDLDIYYGLKLPLSRRLYRYLDKQFIYKPSWSFELIPFCVNKLGFGDRYYPSQLIDKTKNAIAELEKIGFLEPCPTDLRFRKQNSGAYFVTFAKKGSVKPNIPTTESESFINELVNLGIAKSVAMDVISKTEIPLNELRDVIDYALFRDSKGEINDLPSFLVKAIANGYRPPANYRKIKEKNVAKSERAIEEQKVRQTTKQQISEDDAVDAYWQSLDSDAQTNLMKKAIEQADPEIQHQIKNFRQGHPMQRLASLAARKGYILKTIMEKHKNGNLNC